jgi:VWFA-related protein
MRETTADRPVRLAAVITDASGRPVTALAPGDFSLTEDGRQQALDSVDLLTGPRDVALLLDEYHVDAGAEAARVRAAVTHVLNDGLRPGDRVAVIRPLDPLTAVRFSEDRAAALDAVERFEGRLSDLAPRSPAEAALLGTSPALVESGRARIVAAALRGLADRLSRAQPGQGVILFVSRGFDAPTPGRDRLSMTETIVRAANLSHAPIYTFTPQSDADADARAQTPPGEPPAGRPGAQLLVALAAGTGGAEFADGRGLETSLEQVVHGLDGTYLLSYRPTDVDGRSFRRVEVRVDRPDLRVRTQPGYWAPRPTPATEDAPPPWYLGSEASRRPLRRSPLIDLFVGVSRARAGRLRVVVTWEPRAGGPARRRRPATIAATATAGGSSVFEGHVAPADGAGAPGMPASAQFEAPPGTLELDLVVLSADGATLDTDSRDVDLPSPGDGVPLMLPVEVVRTLTARQFRNASADPDAVPTPSREFSRTERLLIRAPAYDADGRALPVRAALLNAIGQVMRDLPSMPVSTRDGLTQFDVRLASYPPGDYQIRFTATTSGSGDISQHIAIRITG